MKFNHLITLSAVALATMAVMPAHAAEPLSASAQAKLCADMNVANAELVSKLVAAKDDADKRQALLIPALKNPNNAFCIVSAVKAAAPTMTKAVLQQILAILAGDPANDPIIKKLTEMYGELLASIDGDIEPAAGPGDTGIGALTSGVPTNPNENPDQFGAGGAGGGGTPPASPSSPGGGGGQDQ